MDSAIATINLGGGNKSMHQLEGVKEKVFVEPERTKERIFNAATELFAVKGFKGTSIRDIAKAVNMNPANLYHYFGSKEGLWVDIVTYFARLLLKRLRHVAEQDLGPPEKLRLLIQTHIRLIRDYDREAKLFFMNLEHLTPEGKETSRQIEREVLAIYLKELQSMAQQGLVRSRSLTVTAFNIFALINWHMRWFDPEGPLSVDETIEEIVSFLMYGIGGPPMSHDKGQGGKRQAT